MAPGRERPGPQATVCAVCSTPTTRAVDDTPAPHRRPDGQPCTGSGALTYVQARRRYAP